MSHECHTILFKNIRSCASNRDEYAGSNHAIDGFNVRVSFVFPIFHPEDCLIPEPSDSLSHNANATFDTWKLHGCIMGQGDFNFQMVLAPEFFGHRGLVA